MHHCQKPEDPALVEKETEYYLDKGINEFNKKFASSKGSGISIANN